MLLHSRQRKESVLRANRSSPTGRIPILRSASPRPATGVKAGEMKRKAARSPLSLLHLHMSGDPNKYIAGLLVEADKARKHGVDVNCFGHGMVSFGCLFC